MSNSELMIELVARYAALKGEFGIRASFEDLDSAFSFHDAILSAGFVSPDLLRQLCARISDVLMNWNSYLHGLVMPDSHYLIQMHESGFLDQADKKAILALIARSMVFVNQNARLHAIPLSSQAASFIDEALVFWKDVYSPSLITFIDKLGSRWRA